MVGTLIALTALAVVAVGGCALVNWLDGGNTGW